VELWISEYGVDSTNLQRVLLSGRRDDIVHAKVRDELTVVVCDMPDGSNCYRKTGVVSPVLTGHRFFCAGFRHCREHLVAVIEGVTQILDKLRFRSGPRGSALFTVFGWGLVFNLVEKREIVARDVFDLLGKGTSAKVRTPSNPGPDGAKL
jgi:hypothetical protein